jgi:hypothetical protein
MRKTFFAMLICLIGWCVMVGARADMVTDSAALDKAYIPALALTSQGNAAQSKAAILRLKHAWQIYAQAHRQDFPGDDRWTAAFSEIENWIDVADGIVAHGGVLIEAHDALEHVRVILMQQRQNHGIDYFLDYQTAFHEPMEAIALTARGKTPETLTPQDLAKIRDTLPELDARWNALRSARFEPKNFGLDEAQAAKAMQLLARESEAIVLLKQALAGTDRAAVIQRALAIKPPFAQLYLLVGKNPE